MKKTVIFSMLLALLPIALSAQFSKPHTFPATEFKKGVRVEHEKESPYDVEHGAEVSFQHGRVVFAYGAFCFTYEISGTGIRLSDRIRYRISDSKIIIDCFYKDGDPALTEFRIYDSGNFKSYIRLESPRV